MPVMAGADVRDPGVEGRDPVEDVRDQAVDL